MRIGAIIQARCNSSRLYNKVLLKLPFSGDTSVLQHIVNRVAKSTMIEQSVIATSDNQEDDQIAQLFSGNVFRGDECHVLSRYYHCAEQYQLDTIVRLSADNPCVDIACVDDAVLNHVNNNYDYSNTSGLPLGTNVEVISFSALKSVYLEAKDPYEIEHVTSYVYSNPDKFRIGKTALDAPDNLKDLRLTLDYPNDYAMLNIIFGYFGNRTFTLDELSKFVQGNPWIGEINPNYQKQSYATEDQEWAAAADILNKLDLKSAADVVVREIKKRKIIEPIGIDNRTA